MLTFNEMQRRALSESVSGRFRESMCDHIRSFAPDRIEAAGDKGLSEFVNRRVDDALALGLRMRGPVRCWLEISVVLGAAFDRDPQHAALMPDLDPESWPMPYAQRLHGNVTDYIQACFGTDRAIVGRVIGETLRRDLPDDTPVEAFLIETVQEVWPERIRHGGEAPIRNLAPAAERAAEAAGLASPRGRLLAATLCLSFGAGVMTDPLYPFLHSRILGSAPEDVRIDRTVKGLRFYARRVAERYPAGA